MNNNNHDKPDWEYEEKNEEKQLILNCDLIQLQVR